MPHFVIECTSEVLESHNAKEIMAVVHEQAVDSKLFELANIKVRIKSYEHSLTAGKPSNFIHVFANIMEGRSISQRSALSKAIVSELKGLCADVPIISVNVWEFEKATYANLKTIG